MVDRMSTLSTVNLEVNPKRVKYIAKVFRGLIPIVHKIGEQIISKNNIILKCT